MKPPKPKPMKMPMPKSKTVSAARSVIAGIQNFAHHPPAGEGGKSRMRRPKGGEGPRNPEE